jgi:hypothetical protein
MSHPIRVRLTALPDGGVHVMIDDRHTRGAIGVLPAAAVAAARAEVERLLSARPRVVLPGRDALRSRAEEAAGRALGALVEATPALTSALGRHLGEARGREQLAAVVIDTDEAWLRALPWELLAPNQGGAPLERTGEAVVVRLSPGRRGGGLRGDTVRIWCPADDPASALVRGGLESRLAALGLAAEAAAPFGAPPDGPALALHIICHGDGSFEQLRLKVGGGLDPGDLAHGLAPMLRGLAVVVLDVCDAGGATRAELDSLAARLVAAGAPAVTAPRDRCSAEAAGRFSQGLYGALSAGGSLAVALSEGRRAVAGLAHPHPDSRWHNHLMFIGDLDVLSAAGAGWRPAGWPPPSAEVAGLLGRALELAGGAAAPFVGLEHLALALEGGAPGEVAPRVRTLLSRQPGAVADRLSRLRPVAGAADTSGSPCLQALGASLPRGFSADALWTAICADRDHILHLLARANLGVCARVGAPGDETMRSVSIDTLNGAQPARGLRVLGGPEGGRVLTPPPGAWIGRWGGGEAGAGALYAGCAVTDPRLSRRHIQWQGGGWIQADRPVVRERLGREERLEGRVALQEGDLLLLGAVTALRVI